MAAGTFIHCISPALYINKYLSAETLFSKWDTVKISNLAHFEKQMRRKNPSAGQRNLSAWLALVTAGEEGPREVSSDGLSESYLLKHFRVQEKQPKSIPA